MLELFILPLYFILLENIPRLISTYRKKDRLIMLNSIMFAFVNLPLIFYVLVFTIVTSR